MTGRDASATGCESSAGCAGFGFVGAAAGRGGLSRAGFAGRTIFAGALPLGGDGRCRFRRLGAFVAECFVVAGFGGWVLTFGAD